MTADERMKYYKEKYSNLSKTGSSVSENGGNSKKSSASKNSAKNAAYLAAEILSIKYPELKEKLVAFRKKLADDAAASGLDVAF